MAFRDYETLRVLGRSAGGDMVYEARQRLTGLLVRLEVIRLRYQYESGPAREHLVARYEAAALLKHPNILPILEMGEGDGIFYIVRPNLAGCTLQEHLRQGRVAPRSSANLVEQLARAAHHAHEHGIFSCNIQPNNVFLTAGGVPLLVGFELARVRFIPPLLLDTRAQAAAFVGTPTYMAPEQVMGQAPEFTPAIDIWGLGALLSTLLTGQSPFTEASVMETVLAVVNADVPSVRTVEPAVERDLDAICMKCLKKKPENRYADALTLAEDLRRYQQGEPLGQPRPASLTQRLGGWMRSWWSG
jgi:serine/threonine protein kinase